MIWVGVKHGEGKSDTPADNVVQQIVAKGGKAVSNMIQWRMDTKIIECAIKHFGRIDIVINNAG